MGDAFESVQKEYLKRLRVASSSSDGYLIAK